MWVGLSHGPLILTCRVQGDSLFIRINGAVVDHNNITDFRRIGIDTSNKIKINNVITQNVTVDLSETTNNTVIICHALVMGQDPVQSPPAVISIAGIFI